jgi:AraC-like DNA-binding protein
MDLVRVVDMIDDGRTKLWGVNVGPYPLHHFVMRPSAGDGLSLPLSLMSTGWDEWVSGCDRHRVNSMICAIEYVQAGRFEFVQGGRRHLVGPGGVFLVKLGEDVEMRTPDKFARKRVMQAEGPCLEMVVNACGLGASDVVEGADCAVLDALFDRAETLFREAPAGFAREASSVVYETLVALGEASKRKALPEPVRKALELFERRIGGRLSLKELAAHCSCSAVTLQRLFRRSLGETPLERFIGMKMELAKALLRLSPEPVKELSLRLGYSSQLYFSTEFRKRVGVSPTEWRKGLSG